MLPLLLWQPHDVNVYVELIGFGNAILLSQRFRNVHHYTNYREYRVSSKMVTHNNLDTFVA
jgi:hypothetical protein